MSDPVDLADWPIPSPGALRRTAPFYLPTANVPDSIDVLRRRDATDETDRVFEVGGWLSGDTGRSFFISTRIPWAPTVPEQNRTPLDTTAWATRWDEAFISLTAEGVTAIKMFDAEAPGVFEVRSFGLDEATTIRLAATARRTNPGETGWTLDNIPDGFTKFAPANLFTGEYRSTVWANGRGRAQAEIFVSTYPDPQIGHFVRVLAPERFDYANVDINGRPGVSVTNGDVEETTIVWEAEPGVFISAALKGSFDETLEFARSIERVDEATFNAATVEFFGDYLVGCTSMFC